MAAAKIHHAMPRILDALRAQGGVFSPSQLKALLAQQREQWRLPVGLTFPKFLAYLLGEQHLQELVLQPETTPRTELLHYKQIVRYAAGDPSPYALGGSLKSGSYLSHGTAMHLHALTMQLPKTFYVNKEQSPKPQRPTTMSQVGIERAFASNPRTSNYIFLWNNYRFVLLSGKSTGRLGVVQSRDTWGNPIELTDVDRTLVDIAVRPSYSGGVHEVLAAYKAARDRASVGNIVAILRKLGHAYPYHQAIGFYMDKAGYGERARRLQSLELKFDFYLTNRMSEKEYVREWRLWVPKGM